VLRQISGGINQSKLPDESATLLLKAWRGAMDLNELLSRHQLALIEMTNARCAEARRWAGERADYFANRIVEVREQMGLASRPFDFRRRLA
jgi:hypothetical protein